MTTMLSEIDSMLSDIDDGLTELETHLLNADSLAMSVEDESDGEIPENEVQPILDEIADHVAAVRLLFEELPDQARVTAARLGLTPQPTRGAPRIRDIADPPSCVTA